MKGKCILWAARPNHPRLAAQVGGYRTLPGLSYSPPGLRLLPFGTSSLPNGAPSTLPP